MFKPTAIDRASSRLVTMVSARGVVPSLELNRQLRSEGFSRTTIERAKTRLAKSGVVVYRRRGARSNPFLAEWIG